MASTPCLNARCGRPITYSEYAIDSMDGAVCPGCGWNYILAAGGGSARLSMPTPWLPSRGLASLLWVAAPAAASAALAGLLGRIAGWGFLAWGLAGAAAGGAAGFLYFLNRLKNAAADAGSWRGAVGAEAERVRSELAALGARNLWLSGTTMVLDVRLSNTDTISSSGPYYHLKRDCAEIRNWTVRAARSEYGCLIDDSGIPRVAAGCRVCFPRAS